MFCGASLAALIGALPWHPLIAYTGQLEKCKAEHRGTEEGKEATKKIPCANAGASTQENVKCGASNALGSEISATCSWYQWRYVRFR